MSHYSPAVAIQMIRFYNTLNERDRRRYAAVEAVKLGHGGIAFISQLLNCDPKTINRGVSELESEEQMESARQRKKGWTEISD
ncbi:hypothetical protein [Endozoicomonas numazuensis]|uniref:hypothetical protein n=1 Tax=Endozoicomonas numazuensis TaxID=1137799 RepID=UPI000AB820B3|nr:hypothetical protein [Endozoicomonas numazuensis]